MLLIFFLSFPAFALPFEVCGRYTLVGIYSCEVSSCKLKIYPGSQSELIVEMNVDSLPSVKKLTGKNIRGWVEVTQITPKLKGAFYQGAAMEFPAENGVQAIKLTKKENCPQ
jgi:hypothetical protein